MQQSTHDIAARAYQLWEEEGRPHGRDLDHWERASSELSSNGNGNGHGDVLAEDELTVVAKPAKKAKAATVDVAVPAKPKRKPSKTK